MKKLSLLLIMFVLSLWAMAQDCNKKIDSDSCCDVVRVACIGNSITEGFGLEFPSSQSWPAVLQQMLGEGFEVKNCGVSARTLLNSGDLPYTKEKQWRDAKSFLPNIVIIKLGTNDSKPWNWKHKEDFVRDYQLMIDTLKALSSHPSIYLCTPIHSENVEWGIRDSVITNEIAPLVRLLVRRNKQKLIDLNILFPNDKNLLLDDGVHPNVDGSKRLAEIICNEIKRKEL